MKNNSKHLVSWLFETKAVRVSPQDKPFWYTAGTIGPYYVNTHFLYGSEESANGFLKQIDAEKGRKLECSGIFLRAVQENYRGNVIFRSLMDEMVSYIKSNFDLNEIDLISGGERRDWFFSLLIADLLDKRHITIFKDLSAVLHYKGESEEIQRLKGKKVLHIADLITEASSYLRAWIPALQKLGAEMKWSLVVIDRLQGGKENLQSAGVQSHTMANIDKSLFDQAVDMGYINREQYAMIAEYIADPAESMRKFLAGHPEFLENALKADEKTRERAQMCLDKNIYGLK